MTSDTFIQTDKLYLPWLNAIYNNPLFVARYMECATPYFIGQPLFYLQSIFQYASPCDAPFSLLTPNHRVDR